MSFKPFSSSLVMFLLFSCLVFSCGNDEELANNPLLGTWRISLIIKSECIDSGNNGSSFNRCGLGECLEYTFERNGGLIITQTRNSQTFVENGAYSVSGTTLSLEMPDGTSQQGVFATVNSNEVTIIFSTRTVDGCIREFSMDRS